MRRKYLKILCFHILKMYLEKITKIDLMFSFILITFEIIGKNEKIIFQKNKINKN